jgi:hypothetical protein
MGAAFALSDHHPTHAQLFQPPAHRNHKATRNVTDGDGLSARKRSEDKIINSGHVFPASLLELRHITKGWLRVKGGRCCAQPAISPQIWGRDGPALSSYHGSDSAKFASSQPAVTLPPPASRCIARLGPSSISQGAGQLPNQNVEKTMRQVLCQGASVDGFSKAALHRSDKASAVFIA